LSDNCDVKATGVTSLGLKGLQFNILHDGQEATVRTILVGKHNVYPSLAAATVGIASGMSLDDISAGLAQTPSTIRIDVKPGLNGSMIIDDSYNASPLSTIAALNVLGELPGRKIAILGDMAELGSYEERGHREVGECAARLVDKLILVGPRARWIGDEATSRGLRDVIFFDNTSQVNYEPRPGEFILVKGSRGMKMEQIVSRLLPPAHQGNGS
jgi:UDP-N-acetylmuramoyl-tripeptide--D-alanyl-D-alanine ligase